jgi:two-component system, NarL family, nitrate/nitrite response regulator NarL
MARAAGAFLDPTVDDVRSRPDERTDDAPEPINVLIVDDERLFAEALSSVLGQDGIAVDRIVSSAVDAIEATRESTPDVVILIVEAPTHAELRAGQAIVDACPTSRVLVLATTLDRTHVQRVFRGGFHGCLSKDTSVAKLVRTLRTIASGTTFPRVDVRSASSSGRRIEPTVLRPNLTPREHEVLQLIATGAAGRTIARRLGISENTVRTHSQSILVKLQVHSRLEAATLAIRTGLVRLGTRDDPIDLAG